MATLEQVEKLRERADVTFEEARQALEAAGDDMLDAMILLERQGKVPSPGEGGKYSGSDSRRKIREAEKEWEKARDALKNGEKTKHNRENSERMKSGFKNVGRFILRLIEIGNNNFFDAIHNGKIVLACPVTVLAILLCCFFWVVVPLVVIGLFFGWRYRFRGMQLGSDAINNVMAKAETAAEEIKTNFINNEEIKTDDGENNAENTDN